MINGFSEKTIYRHDEMHGISFYIKQSSRTYNGDFELCVDIIEDESGSIVLSSQVCYVEHETFDNWVEYGLC